MIADDVEVVVDALSRLIRSSLIGAAHAQYFPCSNPDEMDDRIKEGKERAEKLRVIRNEFENIVTGVL